MRAYTGYIRREIEFPGIHDLDRPCFSTDPNFFPRFYKKYVFELKT